MVRQVESLASFPAVPLASCNSNTDEVKDHEVDQTRKDGCTRCVAAIELHLRRSQEATRDEFFAVSNKGADFCQEPNLRSA
jgi:hypothetical protein